LDGFGRNGFLAGERDGGALGAAADGAALVQGAVENTAAREHERMKRL
jgi:hypothetical protein